MKIEVKQVAPYLSEVRADGEYWVGATSKEEAEQIARDYPGGDRGGLVQSRKTPGNRGGKA